jgi:hypothetical protein
MKQFSTYRLQNRKVSVKYIILCTHLELVCVLSTCISNKKFWTYQKSWKIGQILNNVSKFEMNIYCKYRFEIRNRFGIFRNSKHFRRYKIFNIPPSLYLSLSISFVFFCFNFFYCLSLFLSIFLSFLPSFFPFMICSLLSLFRPIFLSFVICFLLSPFLSIFLSFFPSFFLS